MPVAPIPDFAAPYNLDAIKADYAQRLMYRGFLAMADSPLRDAAIDTYLALMAAVHAFNVRFPAFAIVAQALI